MMPDDTALLLVRETLMIALRIAVPILAAGVMVGLAVSIFQSVTSIQDQTLSFVPKIIAIMLAVILLGRWMAAQLVLTPIRS